MNLDFFNEFNCLKYNFRSKKSSRNSKINIFIIQSYGYTKKNGKRSNGNFINIEKKDQNEYAEIDELIMELAGE